MKSTTKLTSLLIAIVVFFSFSCNQQAKNENATTVTGSSPGADGLDRTSLPIKEPVYANDTTLDARNAKAPARFEVRHQLRRPTSSLCLLMTRASVYQAHLVAR
jgi:hypothetical protein